MFYVICSCSYYFRTQFLKRDNGLSFSLLIYWYILLHSTSKNLICRLKILLTVSLSNRIFTIQIYGSHNRQSVMDTVTFYCQVNGKVSARREGPIKGPLSRGLLNSFTVTRQADSSISEVVTNPSDFCRLYKSHLVNFARRIATIIVNACN